MAKVKESPQEMIDFIINISTDVIYISEKLLFRINTIEKISAERGSKFKRLKTAQKKAELLKTKPIKQISQKNYTC